MRIRTCFALFFSLVSFLSFSQNREIITLQSNWKFALGEIPNAFQKDFDDAKWQTVSIPHDWAIAGPFNINGDGNTGKLPWKGEGWYRYKLNVPSAYSGKRIILVFDGVMAFPQIYVNGVLAGKWDYGYNSFFIDITDLVKVNGDNMLAVHADTRSHDSRWYPGAGIYRKVQLVVVEPVHAEIWGTQITTPIIKSNYASVNVITSVVNQSPNTEDEIFVKQIIISPHGKEISTKETKGKIGAGLHNNFETNFTLTNPEKWEVNNGVLYTLKTIVRKVIKSWIRTIQLLEFVPSASLQMTAFISMINACN